MIVAILFTITSFAHYVNRITALNIFALCGKKKGVLEVQCEKCNVKFHTVSREGSIDDYEWEVNTRGLKMYS